jgi:hypothetical protein
MKRILSALFLILCFAGFAEGQSVFGNGTVQTTTGQAVAGAIITVCTYSSLNYNSVGQYQGSIPCTSPLATYYDPGLTLVQSTVLSSGQGNFFYYLTSNSPNQYTVTVSAPGRITPYGYSVILGGGGSGGGGSGTNQPGTNTIVPAYAIPGTSDTLGPTNCGITGANQNNFSCQALGEVPGISGLTNLVPCTSPGAGNFLFDLVDATTGLPLFSSGTNPCVPMALGVIPGDSQMFVSSQGNDSNSGSSWGSPKLTIMAAYDALPAGGGTINICSNGTYVNATSTSGQGIWLIGPADPNYSSPPSGFRQEKPVTFFGNCGNLIDQQGAMPTVAIDAGNSSNVGIWINGSDLPIGFENLAIASFPYRSVQIGINSNGTQLSTDGQYGVWFENVYTNDCNAPCSSSNGPGWYIGGGNSNDIFLDHVVAQGNPDATPGADNQAAILVKATSATNASANVTITNFVVIDGGIKIYDGINSQAEVVRDGYSESITGSTAGVGTVWLTSPGGATISATQATVEDVYTADSSGTTYDVRVDGTIGLESSVNLLGYFASVKGAGVMPNIPPLSPADPLTQGEQGFFNGKVIGWTGETNRAFTPSAVRYANLASTAESGWAFLGSGNTITTGITAPDGTTGATQAASTSGTLNQVRYYDATIALSVGDYFIGGVWERSTTGSTLADYQALPLVSVLTSGDTLSCQRLLPAFLNNEAWMWVYQVCQVTAVATSPGEVVLWNFFDNALTLQTYAPILLHIPTGTLSQDEIYELANNLTTYSNSCSVGTVCGVSGSPGAGTVTNVTATSPIVVTNGTTTPAITAPTVVTSAASLTANQPIVGGGSQAVAALATAFTSLTTTCTGAQTWAIGSAWVANASITITGSCTLNLTNPLAGGNYVLEVTQGSGGSHTLTLGTGCTWKVSGGGGGAVTPTITAGAIDVLVFTYDGTNCMANYDKNFN